jgi:GT2 family glycosyltransferase
MTVERITPSERFSDPIHLGVVLVAYKSNEVLPECLASLTAALQSAGLAEPESVTVVLVNNDPGQAVDAPDEHVWEQIIIDSDTNLGFSPAVNLGLAAVSQTTDFVLLLNPDTRLSPTCLTEMLRIATGTGAALVGPVLVGPDGRPHGVSERPFHSVRREAARQLLGLGKRQSPYGRRAQRTGEARCLTGACLLAEHRFMLSVGGLDTSIRMYLEDVLLCWQAHEQHRPVLLAAQAQCQHALGGSSGGDDFRSSIGLHLTMLGARVEFMRRRAGRRGAFAMRTVIALGAVIRCALLSGEQRRKHLTTLHWAIVSGEPPEWRNGPHVELPAFFARNEHERSA